MASAVSATSRQSSFHFEEVATEATAGIDVVADVGANRGREFITLTGSGKSGHVEILLVAKTAYFKGDLFGLESFTHIGAALAKKYAGRWISVPSTNSGFASVTGTLTVLGVANQLVLLPGTLTRGAATTTSGVPTLPIAAADSASGGVLRLTEYVSAKGVALPVLVEGTTSATSTGTRHIKVTFGHWGESVVVGAPTGTVPITAVIASGPPASTPTTTTTPKG